MKLLPLFAIATLLVAPGTSAQSLDPAALRELSEKAALDAVDNLRMMLAIPNDAHFPDQVEQNVAWSEQAFQSRGFSTTRLETGGPPLLLAERSAARADATVLIYLQLDGQPVDRGAWDQEDPYRAELRQWNGSDWDSVAWDRLRQTWNPEWRIFARSASDAKGPVAMFLAALDILDTVGLDPSASLRVIMDFEEELGSPHLPAAVNRYRERLAADALLIFDGPRHPSNRPTLAFGARGMLGVSLTVFGPSAPQHSGHYGNYVPNPAMRLAQLLASMKDEAGRVTIPGFYDGIRLDAATRSLLRTTPDDEASIRQMIGIASADRVAPTLQESLQFPSLNIRGMASAWIGDQVRTIIPAQATAEIDVRLVPESDADRLAELIKAHVQAQGYHVIDDRSPDEDERSRHARIASLAFKKSYGPFRTPMHSEVGEWLSQATEYAFGDPPVRVRTMGGSIPISPFVAALDIPAVAVPTVNSDNNQHSPNENLRLGNLVDGIRHYLAILTHPYPSGE